TFRWRSVTPVRRRAPPAQTAPRDPSLLSHPDDERELLLADRLDRETLPSLHQRHLRERLRLADLLQSDRVRQLAHRLHVDLEPARRKLADRKSTRLNSSHVAISYAVFCLKKKKKVMLRR